MIPARSKPAQFAPSLLVFVLLVSCAPPQISGSEVANSGFAVESGSHVARTTVGLGNVETYDVCDTEKKNETSPKETQPQTGEEETPTEVPAKPCQTETQFSASCTGVIISPRKIVTAAHCIPRPMTEEEAQALRDKYEEAAAQEGVQLEVVQESQDYYALFGVELNSGDAHGIAIQNAYLFNYNVNIDDRYVVPLNDIAVVTLTADLPAGYEPAPLPETGDTHVPYGEYRMAWIAGYGRRGDAEYNSLVRPVEEYPTNLNQNPVTIHKNMNNLKLFKIENSTTCHGDSGGPLFAVSQETHETNSPQITHLLGVASWVDNPERCMGNSFYTDVRQYLNFMEQPRRFATEIISYPIETFRIQAAALETQADPEESKE